MSAQTQRGALRLLAFGYRPHEVLPLRTALSTRDDVDLLLHDFDKADRLGRAVEMCAMGPILNGLCMPHVDTRDNETQALGVLGRMGKKLPCVSRRNFYRDLRLFVLDEIRRRGIQPLSPDVDLSVETWLDQTNYTLARKTELRKVYDETIKLDELAYTCRGEYYKHFGVKLFTKDECYTAYKHARGIYAREDAAKIFFGPAVKAMENVIYDHDIGFKEFIKHVPVRDRAKHIYDNLYGEGLVYVATDYSSYECHFNRELMEACEFVLYEYMLSNVHGGVDLVNTMRSVWQGNNLVTNKKLKSVVSACRMSGEMNTSLGNGFSNLMLMLFVSRNLGLTPNGVVEGDDGLFAFPVDRVPTVDSFTELGCSIKLVQHPEISVASFCGLIFAPEDQEVVADPRDVIASMAWSSKRYAFSNSKTQLALLRAKALSALHQYPACPMISEYARMILRNTRSFDVRRVVNGLGWWERSKLLEAVKMTRIELEQARPIGAATRQLVWDQFGFAPEEQQEFEALMAGKTDLAPIDFHAFPRECPRSWMDYYDRFCIFTDSRDPIQYFPWANHTMVSHRDYWSPPKRQE